MLLSLQVFQKVPRFEYILSFLPDDEYTSKRRKNATFTIIAALLRSCFISYPKDRHTAEELSNDTCHAIATVSSHLTDLYNNGLVSYVITSDNSRAWRAGGSSISAEEMLWSVALRMDDEYQEDCEILEKIITSCEKRAIKKVSNPTGLVQSQPDDDLPVFHTLLTKIKQNFETYINIRDKFSQLESTVRTSLSKSGLNSLEETRTLKCKLLNEQKQSFNGIMFDFIGHVEQVVGEKYLDKPTCPLCLGPLQIPNVTKCGHVLCESCLEKIPLGETGKKSCPVCRSGFKHSVRLYL